MLDPIYFLCFWLHVLSCVLTLFRRTWFPLRHKWFMKRSMCFRYSLIFEFFVEYLIWIFFFLWKEGVLISDHQLFFSHIKLLELLVHSTISHLFCILISENQGLEKLRPVSNLRKNPGSAHLIFFFSTPDFFSVCQLIFFSDMYHKPEKNPGD